MTVGEAKIKEGNFKTAVVGQRRVIETKCRTAKDIYATEISNGNYDVIVILSGNFEETRTTVLLDEFLSMQRC